MLLLSISAFYIFHTDKQENEEMVVESWLTFPRTGLLSLSTRLQDLLLQITVSIYSENTCAQKHV